MPSLKLPKLPRRRPGAPSLKDRAAALKASAVRVMRRRAPVAIATPSAGADPRLVAMVAELMETRRKHNDAFLPDGPEADALGERETSLSIAVYRFPSKSVHDLAAKLPFLREEAEDALSGRAGQLPEDTLPGAAWAGLLRDIEHLAAVTPAAVDPAGSTAEGASVMEATARPDPAERNLSREASDYARGIDLSGASYGALYRLYEVFLSAHTLLSPHEEEAVFTSGKVGNFRVLSAAGLVVEAEINRLGCLSDAAAMEMERRKPADRTDNRMRLEVVIAHRMRCEGDISDALLAEYAEVWRA